MKKRFCDYSSIIHGSCPHCIDKFQGLIYEVYFTIVNKRKKHLDCLFPRLRPRMTFDIVMSENVLIVVKEVVYGLDVLIITVILKENLLKLFSIKLISLSNGFQPVLWPNYTGKLA